MKKLIIILIFMFLAVSAFADSPIKAEVDKTKMRADEVLTYKIIINSSEKKTPVPQLPGFEGFYILSQAQSSRISFSGGDIKIIVGYTVMLTPRDTGKFTIGSASVKIKNKTYSTDTFEIEVMQVKEKPKQEPQYKLPKPQRRYPDIDTKEQKPQITL